MYTYQNPVIIYIYIYIHTHIPKSVPGGPACLAYGGQRRTSTSALMVAWMLSLSAAFATYYMQHATAHGTG